MGGAALGVQMFLLTCVCVAVPSRNEVRDTRHTRGGFLPSSPIPRRSSSPRRPRPLVIPHINGVNLFVTGWTRQLGHEQRHAPGGDPPPANRPRPKHGEAYFRFVPTPGVAPPNTLAAQALRFVVIDRRLTQGTRGETGRRWCERIWTVIASWVQQGRSVLDFLYTAVLAHFNGTRSPSLMPSGP